MNTKSETSKKVIGTILGIILLPFVACGLAGLAMFSGHNHHHHYH